MDGLVDREAQKKYIFDLFKKGLEGSKFTSEPSQENLSPNEQVMVNI